MTLMEALERDKRQQKISEPLLSNNNANNDDMPLQGYSPPPSTAPPALIGQKRARNHIPSETRQGCRMPQLAL
jgi:hypothetical protein